jgi:hypothetical protein
MNLVHVSLPAGPEQQRPRALVNDKVLALIKPWLGAALTSGKRTPLSLPAVAHFSARAEESENALRVDLFCPLGAHRPGRPHAGKAALMSTFGVAPDAQAGDKLWRALLQQAQVDWRAPPSTPWCGSVSLPSGLAAHAKAARWLPELQSSIAFAWLSK